MDLIEIVLLLMHMGKEYILHQKQLNPMVILNQTVTEKDLCFNVDFWLVKTLYNTNSNAKTVLKPDGIHYYETFVNSPSDPTYFVATVDNQADPEILICYKKL